MRAGSVAIGTGTIEGNGLLCTARGHRYGRHAYA